ncbi:insulinase family protein [Microbulbifer thermotolerans]|uniref:insulinase family protein n=1 Tax=Microbulbifer thermotolerans TaxID=252514 RepID=UPI002673C4CA|nr:insulinase family protein [Microbulbifer thermotolerans]WKT62048.1 insulinase family protein [Microbulbifer thermotolerans]
MSNSHPAFELVTSAEIESLGVRVEEYRHIKTGAQHLHIAADNPENVFLVALRTVPQDSTGVAHILEHTALCGSEKYPVRDPFFTMIRRSLNTFMNAFTSSDWTAYPFASQNRKDFNNLLDVYLDAVFFSRLDPLDFAQEGHRLEFAEMDNPDSELVYKGVVYNEMKGAMSSVGSQLWQTLSKYLFPSTTYHYNSGGDPADIPKLTYEQLVDFYRSHYHPSNAIFMTFGDIPAAEHQAVFEEKALHKFEPLQETISVGREDRYLAPLRVEEHYPLNEESLEKKTHIVLGWLLGDVTNLEDVLTAHLISGVLLDNSASPLMKLLETTDLGTAPSPLVGLDDSQRELVFVCGIEGSERDRADELEKQILAVLEEVAEKGLPYEQVAASLHQLELHQREITGDGYPYGLQLILTALTGATHRGDAIGLLNIDPTLEKLREQIKDPRFIADKVRQLLVENQHRVRLVLTPDNKLAERREAEEKARLAAIKAGLDENEKQRIVQTARALQERQQQEDDISILPKVGVEDIPPQLPEVEGEEVSLSDRKLTRYSTGTNGLVYQQLICALPEFSEEEKQLLPYYCQILCEVGLGNKDYLEVQQWQTRVAGALHGYTSSRTAIDNLQQLSGHFVLSGKALARNQAALTELMQATVEEARFDELPRIKELLLQTLARRDQSVVGNGHALAMAAASAGYNRAAYESHASGGLLGLRQLKTLVRDIDREQALENLAATLRDIHNKILKAERQFLLIGEGDRLQDFSRVLAPLAAAPVLPAADPNAPFDPRQTRELWVANSQVNFCAKAYATVPFTHPDAAPLAVLGGFLRNGFLHRAIREQGGAYGGGASHDSNIGVFRFYSYRDPRMAGTLKDFDASLQWLAEEPHKEEQVEEAILGVVGALDKPGSPAGEAKKAFHSALYGRTHQVRQEFRRRVTEVRLEDLKRVADTYLSPDRASTAVVTGQAGRAEGLDLGLTEEKL